MDSLSLLYPVMLFYSWFNNDDDIKEADRSRFEVDFNILGQMRPFFCLNEIARTKENVVCSPYSASVPVAELALGAEHETYNELSTALGIASKENIANFFKNSLEKIRNMDGIRLTLANKLYVSDNVKLNQAFKNDLQSVFNTEMEHLNFKHQSGAASTINNWVRQQTNSKITDLIEPNDISDMTVIVLINAVYFKAEWMKPFSKAQPGTFHLKSRTVLVPMMQKSYLPVKHFKSSKLEANIISIPYKNSNTSFVIVLPNNRNGINSLLKKLRQTHYLSAGIKSLEDAMVELHMPKFSFSHTMDLKHSFENIGIKRIFKPRECNLSRISNDKSVFVSKVKQKVFIDVDEQGTEAAAATSVIGEMMSSMVKLPVFKVDHPFFYMVLADGEQLFCGVYRGP